MVTNPDTRLRKISAPVTEFDDALKKLVDDMAETMYASGGIGLAAVQIGELKRVFVIDLTDGKDLRVFVNPVVTLLDDPVEMTEGCLSCPRKWLKTKRATRVKVVAQDLVGVTFSLEAQGLLAQALQHEVDHLNGVLVIDRTRSSLKRLAEV